MYVNRSFISGDRNVIKKEAEKILKYKQLTTQIQRMWNVKPEVIPALRGATGIISKITQTKPEQHTGRGHQATTANNHAGQCTHTAESDGVKAQNMFHGRNNITSRTNCKYRTAATLYTLETWFVSGT
jgi:hypothetical protein